MAQGETLLAHMVPSLTPQVEVAATKALAYVLNKSDAALGALNHLIQDTIHSQLEPIQDVRVEETYQTQEGSGRLDFVGYDKDGHRRVIGESKFWAKLLEGQGSSYMEQLAQGIAVLLFVVPDASTEPNQDWQG